MTSDEREFGGGRPVAFARVQVGVADTTAFKADEAFAGLELGGLTYGVIIDELERCVGRLDNRRLLDFRDLEVRRHGVVVL